MSVSSTAVSSASNPVSSSFSPHAKSANSNVFLVSPFDERVYTDMGTGVPQTIVLYEVRLGFTSKASHRYQMHLFGL